MGTARRSLHARFAWLLALSVGAAVPASAQVLPDGPIVLGAERVVIGGDISISYSCSHAEGGPACTEDTGYFNYSDYDVSLLRMARFAVRASVRVNDHLWVLGDLHTENFDALRPYGVYLRYKPFANRDLDIQAGRIPWTFGSFTRRTYSTDNPLIAYPLAYQYLTSLRPDALPASADDLLRMRGRGWLSNFPIGDQTPSAGLPLAETFRWDTGVQVHGSAGWLEGAGSITTGSLADPLLRDNNSGRHFSARLAAKPVIGLVIGASYSHAPYVTSAAAAAAHAPDSGFTQQVFGADAEYSRDHYVLRVETVASTYDLQTIQPQLSAVGTMVEGRYKLTPRAYVAARIDHLGFNTIAGTLRTDTWEAPVTRWEAGGGYSLQRNVQLRASLQHDARDGGRVRSLTALAGQLLYWF